MQTPPNPRPILCIAVDDAAVIENLSAILAQQPFDVVASTDADAFLARLPEQGPTCALVDLDLQTSEGLDVLRRLASHCCPLPVIAMIAHGDARSAVRAIKAGAFDCIEKPLDRSVVLDILNVAFARSRRRSSSEQDCAAFVTRLKRLTEREHAVFDRMLQGKTNKIIARELVISPRTVEIHRAHVMHKLEAESMAQLVRCATRAALVDEQAS